MNRTPPATWTQRSGRQGGTQVATDLPALDTELGHLYGNCSLDWWQGFYWAGMNEHLLDAPAVSDCACDAPAIVCGSGPSLAASLDKVRAAKGHALILAAHSTAKFLVEHGVIPDVVCPIERIDPKDFLIGTRGTALYAGTPYVPHEPKAHARAVMVVGNGPIADWLGVTRTVPLGRSSGACAVDVAVALGCHPVFLVGHDLCEQDGHTHAAGIGGTYELTEPVLCVDGETRRSDPWLVRVAHDISIAATGATVVQTAPHGMVIAGVHADRLPWLHTNADTTVWLSPLASGNRAGFRVRRSHLPDDLAVARRRIEQASGIDALTAATLCSPRTVPVLAGVLQPLYHQMSVVRRLYPDAPVVEWFRGAAVNVLDGIARSAAEVSRA